MNPSDLPQKISTKRIDNRSDKDKYADQALEEIIESEKGKPLTMEVVLASPLMTYFDGLAYSLSAVNLTGSFDVLPLHHSFICLLVPCTVAIRTTNQQIEEIEIQGGLLYNKANKVQIFLDI